MKWSRFITAKSESKLGMGNNAGRPHGCSSLLVLDKIKVQNPLAIKNTEKSFFLDHSNGKGYSAPIHTGKTICIKNKG